VSETVTPQKASLTMVVRRADGVVDTNNYGTAATVTDAIHIMCAIFTHGSGGVPLQVLDTSQGNAVQAWIGLKAV